MRRLGRGLTRTEVRARGLRPRSPLKWTGFATGRLPPVQAPPLVAQSSSEDFVAAGPERRLESAAPAYADADELRPPPSPAWPPPAPVFVGRATATAGCRPRWSVTMWGTARLNGRRRGAG